DRCEPYGPLAKAAPTDNFAFKLGPGCIAKRQPLAYSYLPSRAHQRLPSGRISGHLPCKQYFYSSAQELAGCGIAWADRLRMQPTTLAQQPRREHSRVVEDHQ